MLQNHISVNTEIYIPPQINFSFEQCVTILGNLLDNAIEACLKLPFEKRWIFIKIQYTNHSLFIKIENSADEIKHWKNGLPMSSKDNSIFHGIGLINVKEILNDCGTISFKSLQGSFTVKILIYDI